MEFKSEDKLLVTLSRPVVEEEGTVNLLEILVDGEDMIPVFTSEALFEESRQGAPFPYELLEVTFEFLLSQMTGDESVIVNPGTPGQYIFHVRELIQKSE